MLSFSPLVHFFYTWAIAKCVHAYELMNVYVCENARATVFSKL